ncbi:hypothetical protein Y032_0005g2652 [Ancylostoma ceylanicum]|nr:hypothetical protein Y032_0005g2652 [Ancylostoma ceylanicum]
MPYKTKAARYGTHLPSIDDQLLSRWHSDSAISVDTWPLKTTLSRNVRPRIKRVLITTLEKLLGFEFGENCALLVACSSSGFLLVYSLDFDFLGNPGYA